MPFLGTRGAGSNRAFGYAGAAKPNQVTGLTATDFGTARAFNNGRIDLSWTIPENNGATILGYKIERSTDNSSYSTIVGYMGKGQSPEQAFGFEKRPWELKYEKTDLLVRDNQYQYIGDKSPFSEPVVVDHEKKIYTTVKLFASTYGLDYSNVSKKIKSGWTVEKILKKSGHLK